MFRKCIMAALLVLAASKASFADTLSHQADFSESLTATAQQPVASASTATPQQLPVAAVSDQAHDLASAAESSSFFPASSFPAAPESSSLVLLGSAFVGLGFLMRRRSQGVLAVAA